MPNVKFSRSANRYDRKKQFEFGLKHLDKTKNYFIEQIKQNDLMSKKHKKVCTVLNHIEKSLILVSAITGCVSISAFVLLVGIPIGIASSAAGLKIWAMTPRIKKCQYIIKKKREKNDELVLLNITEVLISTALID